MTLLNLPYDDAVVPPALLEAAEQHGRRLGVSLDVLEDIGQSLDLTESFIVACEAGLGLEFAHALARGDELPASAVAAWGDVSCVCA